MYYTSKNMSKSHDTGEATKFISLLENNYSVNTVEVLIIP